MSETATTTQTPSSKIRVTTPSARIALVDLTPNNVGTLRKLNSVLFPVSYSDKFYNQVLDEYLSDFCKLIYYNDLPVGAVCCRIEPDPRQSPPTEPTKNSSTNGRDCETKLYIMTLGVLAPYRRLGLATKLLDQVIQAAQKTHTSRPAANPIMEPPPPAPVESKKSLQKGKKCAVAKSAEVSKVKDPVQSIDQDDTVPIPLVSSAYVHVQFGNEDARDFYIKRGFHIEGELPEYYRKIEPRGAWVLTKQVASQDGP